EAKDGPLAIAVGNNAQFKRFCHEVIQRPDLADDPDFATNQLRSTHRDKLMPIIKAALKEQPRQTLLARLHDLTIPCGEVLGMNEALRSQRSQQAGMLVAYDSDQNKAAYCLAAPYRFNGQRVPTRYTPPELAENTREILAETLGLDDHEIEALQREKVIK